MACSYWTLTCWSVHNWSELTKLSMRKEGGTYGAGRSREARGCVCPSFVLAAIGVHCWWRLSAPPAGDDALPDASAACLRRVRADLASLSSADCACGRIGLALRVPAGPRYWSRYADSRSPMMVRSAPYGMKLPSWVSMLFADRYLPSRRRGVRLKPSQRIFSVVLGSWVSPCGFTLAMLSPERMSKLRCVSLDTAVDVRIRL